MYENREEYPRIGDYVKFNHKYFRDSFFITEIGQIINIDADASYKYLVKFDRVNPMNNSKLNRFSLEEFSNWDSNKDLLIMWDDINKYNL
jgi:hypothetical protein